MWVVCELHRTREVIARHSYIAVRHREAHKVISRNLLFANIFHGLDCSHNNYREERPRDEIPSDLPGRPLLTYGGGACENMASRGQRRRIDRRPALQACPGRVAARATAWLMAYKHPAGLEPVTPLAVRGRSGEPLTGGGADQLADRGHNAILPISTRGAAVFCRDGWGSLGEFS
jgi:hypothetical protein